ncbi:MAG: hypothetical protein HC908_00385 [Calothrix sp. SM1_7_51]|nr:hypothetical protein [Calothrix sp. SM1_7_51]
MQPKPEINGQVNLHIAKSVPEIFCYHCGSKKYHKKGHKEDRQTYFCSVCRRHFYENRDFEKHKTSYLELGDDVWDASEIGVEIRSYRNESKLVFLYFHHVWLKNAVKKFIRYRATNKSFRRLKSHISDLMRFDNFRKIYYPTIDFKSFTRKVIIDFLDYLNQKNLGFETKNHNLGTLNTFFEVGNMNGWFDVPAYLIRPEDYAKRRKILPRYIPEEVMQQLNQHLDALPEPVARMVLVIQETGLRVGELLTLPINCLKHDLKGSHTFNI